MIKAVRCDNKSFKTITFTPGFNVILAERIKTAGDKDSRNGLGKTTLIEIIHFCLGSSTKPSQGLRVPELNNWTFILDITVNEKDISVYRNTENFGFVKIEGDFSNWKIKPDLDDETNEYRMKIKDWNICLGDLFFNLEPEIIKQKYSPTFRSLISYFGRLNSGAFEDAFKHYSQQKTWDIQVNNTFLLGLNWEYASRFQILKDNESILNNLKKAAKQGIIKDYFGSLGELDAERISLEEKVKTSDSQLQNFKVHPQYLEVQNEANRITRKIHELVNERTLNQKLLDQYKISISEEKDIPVDNVERIYRNAGLVFSGDIKKKLDDVIDFHIQIMNNRKSYLETEIKSLSRLIESNSKKIEELSNKRAEQLAILKTHGALDEYIEIQRRNTELKQELSDIESRITNLKKFEKGKSDLKIEKEELLQKTRTDYDERKEIADVARRNFNQNSEKLYDEPGRLTIDISDTGYKLGVEIKRTRSQGIGYMKVLCYDLMLVQLRANLIDSPGFLIHDSTIFNGVDERQIAKALELAAKESEEKGFQYIVTLNSDQIPFSDFPENSKESFEQSIRIKFTDDTDDGGLLGFRY